MDDRFAEDPMLGFFGHEGCPSADQGQIDELVLLANRLELQLPRMADGSRFSYGNIWIVYDGDDLVHVLWTPEEVRKPAVFLYNEDHIVREETGCLVSFFYDLPHELERDVEFFVSPDAVWRELHENPNRLSGAKPSDWAVEQETSELFENLRELLRRQEEAAPLHEMLNTKRVCRCAVNELILALEATIEEVRRCIRELFG